LKEEVDDVTSYWTDDMVGFLIGCSFSWENSLSEAGLIPRHIEGAGGGLSDKTVPMYKTNVRNAQSGVFQGDLVVSMRPYPAHRVLEVEAITAKYPGAHGGPIHWGDPSLLGIGPAEQSESPDDETRWHQAVAVPDFGDPVEFKKGEIPVFWACGVTPQTALREAKLPLVITHAPGHMFICDILDHELIVP
jgi:uncharacterized protein YcsI (UPF0317 family)